MKKNLKAFVSMLFAMALCMSSSMPITAFAAEADIPVASNETDIPVTSAEAEEDLPQIEDIDPNIIVIVTEITDDTPSTFDLRKTTTTFNYTGILPGRVREYKGNHFSIDLTTSSESNKNFRLSLVRGSGTKFDPVVGKVELPQNGSFHVEFLNVNKPGQYHIDLFHPYSSERQIGDMTIWDWD